MAAPIRASAHPLGAHRGDDFSATVLD